MASSASGPSVSSSRREPHGGGERRQVEDAPAAHLTAVAVDPDVGSELLGQPNEFIGGSKMKAEDVVDLDLSADAWAWSIPRGPLRLGRRPGTDVKNPSGPPLRPQLEEGIVIDGLG